MPPPSAGILLFRRHPGLRVLLIHPGGPFWRRKDDGAWSIPKGQVEAGEEPLAAALREFKEETGFALPAGDPLPLTPVRLRSGKRIHAWALEGDAEPAALRSNTMRIEWPPRTGRFDDYPEADRAAWFTPTEARRKINEAQGALVDELERLLAR